MPKYMIQASYTTEGVKGLMKESFYALAIWAAITSSGSVQIKTTPLMTPEEMDQATKKMVAYRPPGH